MRMRALCQVSKLLQYSPLRRLSALQALSHPFFAELREAGTTLPNGACSLSPPSPRTDMRRVHDPYLSPGGSKQSTVVLPGVCQACFDPWTVAVLVQEGKRVR